MKNFYFYVTLSLTFYQSKAQLECNRHSNYSCCYNQYLNNKSNTCIECPYGSYGWNCKSTCPSGFYGRLCLSPCACVASECHGATGCITTTNEADSTITFNAPGTSQLDYFQLSTITNIIGEVSTYYSLRPSEVDRHIHIHDDHESPLSIMGFSLLGSLSTICIIGCVLFIRSRKKQLKLRSTPGILSIRQVALPCMNEDRQREAIQGSKNIELSNVNKGCGQENDSPYSEIRYSQFIDENNTRGACVDLELCLMHKCNHNKHHFTSENQNTYQMPMGSGYNHVNLKLKSSDVLPDKNLSITAYNDEEYVSFLNKQSLCDRVRKNDDSKCTNLTLYKKMTTDLNEMGKFESKSYGLSTGYSLQKLEFEMEVEVDQHSEKTKQGSVGNDRQMDPISGGRPYSMACAWLENDSRDSKEKESNLQNINISENENLPENDQNE